MREEQREGSNGRAEPDRIEDDIRLTQARIEDHIEALREELSPGQILDGVIKSLRGGPGGFLQNLGRQLRDNPVPVALLGTGVAWLMWNERRESTGSIGEWGSAEPSHKGEASERVRDKGEEIGAQVKGRSHEYAGRARQLAGRTRERTRERAEHMKERVSRARRSAMDAFEDQPLALGALGLAIGALLGATGHRPGREIYGDIRGSSKELSGEAEGPGIGVSPEAERAVEVHAEITETPVTGSAERVNVPSAGPREPYASAPQSGPARDIGTKPTPTSRRDPYRR